MRLELRYGLNEAPDSLVADQEAETIIPIQALNQPFPLQANTVDFVMASHSLQYVSDLPFVMEEIYRVCKHKAIVCIVAPYAHVTSHIVHPLYRQPFNEHLPRYWTNHPSTLLNPAEYLLSWQKNWPLMEKQQAEIPIDLRLLQMEFFYFPQYGNLYEDIELMLLRQSQLNVAYQIMYHLLVVKQPISDGEMNLIASERLDEPHYIEEQRQNIADSEVDEKLFEPEALLPILERLHKDTFMLNTLEIPSSPKALTVIKDLPAILIPGMLNRKKKNAQKRTKGVTSKSTRSSRRKRKH